MWREWTGMGKRFKEKRNKIHFLTVKEDLIHLLILDHLLFKSMEADTYHYVI